MSKLPRLARPTGGQINVAGILYQMLASLSRGLNTTVAQLQSGQGARTVELLVEPFDGGDVQVEGSRREIIQIKTRAQHLRWSNGALVREVLPDLFQAARAGSEDAFVFMTDNDRGCDDFRRFLTWYRETKRPTGLVLEEDFRFGRGNPKVSGATVLRAIDAAVGNSPDRLARIDAMLSNMSIEKFDEIELIDNIDQNLRVLVEAWEDVPNKRLELIGSLVQLGRNGTRTTTSELLEKARLDPRRFLHVRRLPALLRDELTAVFPLFRYDATADVRPHPPAPRRPVTVLRGESGLGKTWQLCSTANALADAGRPVILLRAAAGLEALTSRIVTTIWNPVYGAEAPLRSVADRLRPALSDDRGVWLTVFLDDLNDPELASRIIEAGWDRLGIDLVVSSQPMTADWLRRSPAAPEVVEVEEFSVQELSAYLARNDVDQSVLPDDLFLLLQKPILARLYVSQLRGRLLRRPETEYELMESFWTHAVQDRPAQVRHPFDLDRLELLVGDMLVQPPIYPWPPSTFARILDYEAVSRLAACGLVELDGDRRLSITHDRLLNWAMASHLASLANHHSIAPQDLALRMREIEGLQTAAGVRIGGRLGYVLLDLVWLLLKPGRWSAQQVGTFLMAYMRDEAFDAYNQTFFTELLPTLGPRCAGLFRAMVELGFDGQHENFWPEWIGKGLRRIGFYASNDVLEAGLSMFSSGDPVQVNVSLNLFGVVSAPSIIGELFEITMQRAGEAQTSSDDDRITALNAKSRAFDAFARAAAGDTAWLNREIEATSEVPRLSQLLWALLQLERRKALPIWRAQRDHLFSALPSGARVLPQAVRTFAEREDLDRLSLPSPEGADYLSEATTFDAIARLAPRRALNILNSDVELDLLDLMGTEGWWLPGLHFRYRAAGATAVAIRNRFLTLGTSDGPAYLASLYSGFPEYLDEDTVDVLLNALEAVLTARQRFDERLQGAGRLLTVLSTLKTGAALNCVAARRGTPLEDALARLMEEAPPRSSRMVDRDGESIAVLLAEMGGDGFDRLVLAQLASTGTTTRDYGLRHALWTTSTAVGDRLEAIAAHATQEKDGPYGLMQALAAHGRDRGLAHLISQSAPVYTHAAQIRQAQGSRDGEMLSAIQTRVGSDEPAERLQAVDLAHFLGAEESLAATAPLIALAEPGDELSAKLLSLHFDRNHYEPALLPKLLPLLDAERTRRGYALLHLAFNGDAIGRRAALEWLLGPGTESPAEHCAQAALALLEHDDARDGAIKVLQGLRTQSRRLRGLQAEILAALSRHGDRDAEHELVSLAYGAGRGDARDVSEAVRLVARDKAVGAYEAARRLFTRSGQASAAEHLLNTEPSKGLSALIADFITAPDSRRPAIARALRWRADSDTVVPALKAMAIAADQMTRQAAVEIAGWLPHDWNLPFIRQLMSDPVRAVETAALEAAARHAAGVAAAELMAVIPQLPKPTQWALLRALVKLVDPYLLAHRGDVLQIYPLIDALPPEFAIEAERLVEKQVKEVDRKLEQAKRREA